MNNRTVIAIVAVAGLAAVPACKSAGMTPAMRTEITTKLASAQAPITACYQKSLTTNRKLRGMYVVQLTATADTGQFTEIQLRRDEPQDPVLKFCVIQELAKLRLDKPPGERIVVDSVPIKFDWANP